jgi:cytoskeletal protein CcmA (bactofilin family)
MKDDVAAPNLGQANKEFDAQYFWQTYRTIEQWMQQTTSKGNVSVASLTADTLEVEDAAVSGDVTIGGDLTVDGTIEGVLTAIPDPLVVNVLTVNTDATIGDDLTVTDVLTVNGVSALKNTTVTGTLGVTSNATIGGTLGVTGTITGNLTRGHRHSQPWFRLAALGYDLHLGPEPQQWHRGLDHR